MDSADLDGGHKLLEIRMAMLGPIFCIHKDSGEISLTGVCGSCLRIAVQCTFDLQ